MIYHAVLAVALAGAVMARLRPDAMARAMLASAVVQVLVFFAALIAGLGFTGPITVFFTSLWLASARLFHEAASEPARRQEPVR